MGGPHGSPIIFLKAAKSKKQTYLLMPIDRAADYYQQRSRRISALLPITFSKQLYII